MTWKDSHAHLFPSVQQHHHLDVGTWNQRLRSATKNTLQLLKVTRFEQGLLTSSLQAFIHSSIHLSGMFSLTRSQTRNAHVPITHVHMCVRPFMQGAKSSAPMPPEVMDEDSGRSDGEDDGGVDHEIVAMDVAPDSGWETRLNDLQSELDL
jgi:hypothetical protein